MLRRVLPATLALSVLLTGTALASSTGPDVSHHQHPNDVGIGWTALKQSGQAFEFHKATEGSDYLDPSYAKDTADARSVGLIVGAYHFARPSLTPGSAAAQAKYFVSVTGTLHDKGELPPVLDLEVTGGLTPAQLIAWTKTWLGTVEDLTGRVPMIYSFRNFWRSAMAATTEFRGYPLWGACYCGKATRMDGSWSHWTFWQWTDASTYRGIHGKNDANVFNGTRAQLEALADGTKAGAIITPIVTVGTVLTARAPLQAKAETPFVVTGTLRSVGGSPVAGRPVVLAVRATGTSTWYHLARATTRADGSWRAAIHAPFEVQVRAQYSGGPSTRPSTSHVVDVAAYDPTTEQRVRY